MFGAFTIRDDGVRDSSLPAGRRPNTTRRIYDFFITNLLLFVGVIELQPS